ncbi:hypothetical protein GCM10022226_43020 [Sphaerisporangium flaviroseum]|uniref:Bacterial transcriptional activator domain-containing protein n=1 Tax=Sphaerisporangium flaviroseum TaxID=509199 RepID=A0ABP7IGP6_9ACTN
MRALYASDRRADTLDAYRRARQALIEELGLEPGRGLQELHQVIPDGRPVPAPDAAVPGHTAAPPSTCEAGNPGTGIAPPGNAPGRGGVHRPTRQRTEPPRRTRIEDLSVRSAFTFSHRGLENDPSGRDLTRLFCLLGVSRRPQATIPLAAALAGTDLDQAQKLLGKLLDICFLKSVEPDCYQMPDLLRLFAREQAHRHMTSCGM